MVKYDDWEKFLVRQTKEDILTAFELDFPYVMQPFLRQKWEEFKAKVMRPD